LEKEKMTARTIIEQARKNGKNITINGILEIKYVD